MRRPSRPSSISQVFITAGTQWRRERASSASIIVAGAILALALAATRVDASDLGGHWSGRMEPTNLSAQIDIDLQRKEASWTAGMRFRAGPVDVTLPIVELRVEDEALLVRTQIEGADVIFDFALEDELMQGSVRVTEKGNLLAEGPAGLARATDEEGQQQLIRWLDAHGTAMDAPRRDVVIERALELFLTNYVDSERAERAAADVRARAARGEYRAVASPARLAELLGRHLVSATADRHVQIKVGSRRAPDPVSDSAESTQILAQLRVDAAAEGFGIGEPKVLAGNVGYLEFKRFLRADVAGDALAAAMRELEDTDALILDLRTSRGGDPAMAVLAASWLFDGRPRHWNDIRRRVDATTTQYWTAAWLPGPRFPDRPVYVLTARRTFSAPESLAYELQQTERATIVGEVTGGGAHSGAWYPIDDQFAIFIPLSRYVSAASGGDWEGVGVQPDIACAASEALDCAHRAALERHGQGQGEPTRQTDTPARLAPIAAIDARTSATPAHSRLVPPVARTAAARSPAKGERP